MMSWRSGYKSSKSSTSEDDLREAKRKKLEEDEDVGILLKKDNPFESGTALAKFEKRIA